MAQTANYFELYSALTSAEAYNDTVDFGKFPVYVDFGAVAVADAQ